MVPSGRGGVINRWTTQILVQYVLVPSCLQLSYSKNDILPVTWIYSNYGERTQHSNMLKIVTNDGRTKSKNERNIWIVFVSTRVYNKPAVENEKPFKYDEKSVVVSRIIFKNYALDVSGSNTARHDGWKKTEKTR